MGTNYYWQGKPPCPTCGHQSNPVHIGKSSAGWVFALHVMPESDVGDLDDWKALWARSGEITDEYGRKVTVEEMLSVITERGREPRWDKDPPFMYESWQEFHRRNESMEGPNGLVRSLLSARCVKHGAGTWDCFVGEFS